MSAVLQDEDNPAYLKRKRTRPIPRGNALRLTYHMKRACSSATVSLVALAALVAQNTALVIFLKLSFRDGDSTYSPSAAVLVTELAKVSLCSLKIKRSDVFLAVSEIRGQWILFVPSALYVWQNNLLFFAAERLSPVAYIVCSQSKILTTAALSRVFLGTKLSTLQCISLFLLVLGIILVQISATNVRLDIETVPLAESVAGICAILTASFTSATAGIVLEKIYKTSSESITHTIWSRNVQLGFISIPFAYVGWICARLVDRKVGYIFSGFDTNVWAVITLQAAGGIITAFVMKFANNIVKCLAIALSICCCAVYSVIKAENQLSTEMVVGIATVMAASLLYAMTGL